MKHISAVLGSPQVKYVKKFAWFPKRLNNGSIAWLKDYFIQQLAWDKYDQDKKLGWSNVVLSQKYLSVEDATIEKLKNDK